MTVLRALRKLVLGETWSLPIGVATVVALTAGVVRPALSGRWAHAGGFALLAGIGLVLVLSVAVSARPRRTLRGCSSARERRSCR